jgi:PKHD-type hydroxylase
MMLHVPKVLSPERTQELRRTLDAAQWIDGKVTAGYQSAQAKNNRQLAEDSPVARKVGGEILTALSKDLLFLAAALPLKIFPPLFNRYEGGESFGNHVDNSVRFVKGTDTRIRTDLACTLFFSEPEEYEGGELIVEDNYGSHSVKLPAGDMILYPATSLHRVEAVTRGARVSSFFWLQSMIRDNWQRTMLFDMDMAIQRLRAQAGDNPQVVQLTSIYHNLIRMWGEV